MLNSDKNLRVLCESCRQTLNRKLIVKDVLFAKYYMYNKETSYQVNTELSTFLRSVLYVCMYDV